jgi:hypothetical protein
LQKINDLLTAIGLTAKTAGSLRNQTLSAQGRVAEQGARIDSALTAIQNAQKSAFSALFTRDSEPLWNLDIRSASEGSAGQESLAVQIIALQSYLGEKVVTLIPKVLQRVSCIFKAALVMQVARTKLDFIRGAKLHLVENQQVKVEEPSLAYLERN